MEGGRVTETLICKRCGHELERGIAILTPVRFPDDREDYESIALGARRVAPCPQCGAPNEDLEVCSILVFRPKQTAFIQMPEGADESIVRRTRDSTAAALGEGWTLEITQDPDRFRTMALMAVVGLVEPLPFNELRPAGTRDFAYHSALVSLTRPGLLRLQPDQPGITDAEALDVLVNGRRAQIAFSFIEAFADAEPAGLDPAAAVGERFPPDCFDLETLGVIEALIEARESEGADALALRAALAAAARHGGAQVYHGVELARALVRLMDSGTALQQDPAVWASLLDAEEVFRAIGAEAPPRGPQDLQRIFGFAKALGHGDAVAKLLLDRARLEPDKLEAYVEAVVSTLDEQGADDETAGMALARVTRAGDLDIALQAATLAVNRVIEDRPLAAMPVVRDMAARLKNEGEPSRALRWLDVMEARLPDALPPEARSHLLNERGNALRGLHRYDEALKAYRDALDAYGRALDAPDARVVLTNEARTLRDQGRLQASLDAFTKVLPHTSGYERFGCLFGMVITHQRAGDWTTAQTLIDEASGLIRSTAVDDQIARFALARNANARILGLPTPANAGELNAMIVESPLVSARQQLLTLGDTTVQALRLDPEPGLRDHALELARSFSLERLASDDPEFAVIWADAARLAGDDDLARATLTAILAGSPPAIIAMHAACLVTEIACWADDWAEAARFVERASDEAVRIAAAGSEGTDALGVAETLEEVRRLGVVVADAPDAPEYERLVSRLADIQSSLLLSLRLGGIAVAETLPPDVTVQALQWLDAGGIQVPVLTRVAGSGTTSRRGVPLPTGLAEGLGERMAGRVTRSPAITLQDVLDGVAPYRVFREALLESVGSLDVDGGEPLTIVPSAVLVGIPLHHALGDWDVAYAPSLAVATSLAARASEESAREMSVAEVRCSCFDDEATIIKALVAGGAALQALCERHDTSYRCVQGLLATCEAVAGVLAGAEAVKLSCHGITDARAGVFALVLSDGSQLPPPLTDIARRDDLAKRYLFDWSEMAGSESRCRIVVSSACTSGAGLATDGGEQVGLARAYLASGVLAFVAPLWPVAAGPAQELANAFIERYLAEPELPLATVLRQTRDAMGHLPPRVRDAFVLHGHAGALFGAPNGGSP